MKKKQSKRRKQNEEERKQVGLEMTQSEAMAFSREKKNLNMA